MNKKIKIISIAVVLFSIVSAVYAHTYVAVYGDNNGNTIGITSMDYSKICGNVYTGQTFILYLRKVSQLN
jgi:hypothetical protein